LVGKPSEVILLLTGRTSVAQVDVLGEPATIAAFMRSDRSL
ncbi:MAG: TIGR03085 family protein, partial [Cutibacterium sp.]|nr:TIGR03085 family protein [Xanthomonas citri pv. citri]MCA3774818.1 TIGR03085 family protein [Cutibacterium sp.]